MKRMRVFAGPNGSGKTTMFKALLHEKQINLGIYVNADDIEVALNTNSLLDFNNYGINADCHDLIQYFRESTFAPVKRNEPDMWEKLTLSQNKLYVHTVVDSYLCADLAEWLRRQLMQKGMSFTYETVMSHPDKISFMKLAQKQGYRVYMYYIATEDPEINISRVNIRVALNGHPVRPEVVRNRYFKSLNLLKDAIEASNRAYLWDNSGSQAEFIAEISDGTYVQLNEIIETPAWVDQYLFSKP